MKITDINGRERECTRIFLDPHWPGFVTVEFQSKNRIGYKHTEWMPTDDFLSRNPNLKGKIPDDDAPIKRPPQIAGEVTLAGPDTLTDSSRQWDANAYAGIYVWISRGKGEGQVRTVLANTKNKLRVDKPWDTKPNKTSQYSLIYNKPTIAPQGNTLPIAEMRKLEEKARKLDIKRGVKPAPKQYT